MLNNYTISLEEIIEQIWREGHPDETHSIYDIPSFMTALEDIDKKVEFALPYIFSFDFPCYGDEEDRLNLEKHIIHDYYTRNICCDSFARWLLFLKARMDDIMPRYTALYNAQAKLLATEVLEPMRIEETRDIKTSNKKDRSNTQKTTSVSATDNTSNSSTIRHNEGIDNTDTNNENRFSNLPQATLMQGADYLTNMTTDSNESKNTYSDDVSTSDSDKSNTNATASGTADFEEMLNALKDENYSKIMKGNLGRLSNGKLIKEYQDVILNIEQLISKDLNDLFYLIY